MLTHVKNIAKRYGRDLVEDPAMLKSNAVILSSLVLVLSRIGVANASAQMEKNTPNGKFRYVEALKTTIREILGFTLTYLVLRVFDLSMKFGIRKGLEIPQADQGIKLALIRLGKQIKQFVKGEALDVIADEKIVNEGRELAFHAFKRENNSFYNKTSWLINLFKLAEKGGGREAEVAAVKKFYKYFPLILGSIPALILSGYWSERFTLDHSQDLIRTINRWVNGEPKPTQQPSTTFGAPDLNSPFMSQASHPNPQSFSPGTQFFANIRQKQFQRGFQ
jgi:hypothetical protein